MGKETKSEIERKTGLIKITENESGSVVSARELHEFLEVKTPLKDWFPRMVEYGFEGGEDFSAILSESTGGRPSVDYAITLDMAKEVSMLQRTDKGKQARRYFIDCEKRVKEYQFKNILNTLITKEVIKKMENENSNCINGSNELIKITESSNGSVVSARELYDGL